jgi:hypothetical protein
MPGTQELIRKLFSRDSLIEIMGRLPNLQSPALDFLYPVSARINHPLPVISYRDLMPRSGNIPLVKRGSQSIAIAEGSSLSAIEPQPVSPSSMLDAVDLNNLLMFEGRPGGSVSQQTLIANRIDSLRRICRDTAQALAIQSVSGKIDYAIRGPEGTFLKFEIDFGTPAAVACSTLFDATGVKVGHIITQLAAMKAKLQAQGFGNDVVFLAPADVYAAITNVFPSAWKPEYDSDGFLVLAPTLKIALFDYKYFDHQSGTSKGLAAKTLVAWDRGAGSSLIYAAVDDIDANFEATPFWAKAVKSDDPSGYKVIGQSKPIPVPNVKGIATSVVLS